MYTRTGSVFAWVSFALSLDASAHSGDLDTHFGTAGTAAVTMSSPLLPLTQPIAIDGSNRILFGVSTRDGDLVGALNADGSHDSTFGVVGILSLDQYLADVKVDSKNRVVVLQSDASGSLIATKISRFLRDGSVDTSFGVHGAILFSRADEDIVPSAIALDAADNVFVVGTEPSDPATGDSRIMIVKTTSDGATDPTFAGGKPLALTTRPVGTEQSYGQAIAVDSAGSIVVTGYTLLATKIIVDDVVKLQSDGTLDPTFGAGAGFIQTDALAASTTPHYTFSESIAIDDAGDIVTAGFAGDWGDYTSSFLVARYLPDGTIDHGFNTGVPKLLNIAGHHFGQAATVMIDARDRIVLTGLSAVDAKSTNQFAVFRLDSDGSRDLNFGSGDGSTLLPDRVAGGRGAFGHGQEIIVIGNRDDGSALLVNELVDYDVPPILWPDHF